MFNKSFSLIVAFDKSYGIGLKNSIPWKLPHDMSNFKKLTTNNIIIMGKKTWDSLHIKPLPNRVNIVLTSSKINHDSDNVHFVNSFEEALNTTSYYNTNKEIFVIGGSKVYEEALKHENCQILYLSILDQDYKCDTFFPSQYLNNFKIISDNLENGYIYRKCKRLKNEDLINQEEIQYLNLVKDVLTKGVLVKDRTQIGRIVRFGNQMRFNLENNNLPLLTTKKMFVKGVIGELLWMLNGETDSKLLEKQNINIWKGNSSRKFLDDHNLKDYEEGECGPIYGFQWRRFNGDYKKINSINKYFNNKKITDTILQYSDIDLGYDQVSECIRLIKEEPNSTRIIITGWNPSQLEEQVLPACHSFYQFNVIDNKLSCMLTLRSNDISLGAPYNICSASLLTYIMAQLTGLQPYELIYSVGNYHIYNNHMEQMKEQITRNPFAFPKFNFKRKIKSINELNIDDFVISGYNSHPSIKMEMAV